VQQAEAKPAPPPELFRLALAIDRPIAARAARSAAKVAPGAATKGKQAAPDQIADRVSKRELPMAPENEAEMRFRQGVSVLNQGRVGDAEAQFKAALSTHPGHEASRQALIALMIEQRNLAEARRLLEEGLAQNPAQVQFAAVLARVLVEGGDYAAAAKVLDTARQSAVNDADYHLLHGVVLQRLGRHAEAVDVLQRATQISDQQGATWVAMGVSFEAMGRRADALTSYRRSLSAAPLAQEVRAYAEGRIRALN
jgi:tetratricopeptide (TPR) repeat protein